MVGEVEMMMNGFPDEGTVLMIQPFPSISGLFFVGVIGDRAIACELSSSRLGRMRFLRGRSLRL